MLVFMIIGSLAFALYIYFSVGIEELQVVVESLDISSFLFYYILSFLTMLFVMFLWTGSWFALLKALSIRLGVKKTFLYYMAGDFVDRFVPSPGVVGEVMRAYFVRKETLYSYGVIAVAGITNRIIAYGVVVGGLSVGMGFLLLTQTVPAFASGLLILVWFSALLLFVLLSFISLREDAAEKLVSAFLKLLRFLKVKRNVEDFSMRAFKFLSRFREGFKFFGANPYYLIAPIIFNILSFIFNLLVYILVFNSLGLNNLPLDFFIVVYFLAGAIQDGAASFSVGGLEILLTNITIIYGVSPATSSVAAVILRSVTFYFPLILGYIVIQVIGARKILDSTLNKTVTEEEIE
jgi:uncharacterized protein (TIRG00374 family)